RLSPDQRKQSGTPYDPFTICTRDFYRAKAALTIQPGHLRVQVHVNASMRFDSVDQIPRHVLTQVRAANDERHGTAALGQEHCRLTRRVATPHDNYRCTRAESRFEWRRGVVDAVAFELFQTIDRQPPVSRASGGNDRPRGDVGAIAQTDYQVTALLPQPSSRARTRSVRAKFLSLDQ